MCYFILYEYRLNNSSEQLYIYRYLEFINKYELFLII